MALVTDLTCVLPRPDIGELHSQLSAELSKRLLGGGPVLPMSADDVLAFVIAGAVNLTHGFVTQALKENDPATMCCDNLVTYGAQHGIQLRGATRAKGYIALSGTAGALIPSTMRFVASSSREYKLDPAVTFNPKSLGPDGAVVRVVSVTAGAVFNAPTGTVMTVATTTPGINGEAIVVGNAITGGSDNEDCEELRMRIMAYERAGALTTTAAWYCQKTMTYPGVTQCCEEECNQCCDPMNLTIYPFMHGVYGDKLTAPYGVPPVEVLEEMTHWMFGDLPGMGQGLAPFGIRGKFCAAQPTHLTMKAYCHRGCPSGTTDRIKAGLQTYIANNTCVGTPICKGQMATVAYMSSGIENCFSSISFEFDGSVARQDNAFAYLDCGHFLVIEDVVLTTEPPPVTCAIVTDQVSILGCGVEGDPLRVAVVDAGERR